MTLVIRTGSKPGCKPSIATHPACVETEFACAHRISLRRVAERFGVSRAGIDRHRHALTLYHSRLVGLATELNRYEARIREVYAALAVMVPQPIAQGTSAPWSTSMPREADADCLNAEWDRRLRLWNPIEGAATA